VELNTTYASSKWSFFGDALPFKYVSCGVSNKEDVVNVACLELLAVFLLLDGVLPDGISLNYATAFEIAMRMTDADRMTLQLACGSKQTEEMVEEAIACKKMRDRVFLNRLLFNSEPGKSEEEVVAVLYEWSQSKEFKDNTNIVSTPNTPNIMMELARIVRYSLRFQVHTEGLPVAANGLFMGVASSSDVFANSFRDMNVEPVAADVSLPLLYDDVVAGACCVCGMGVFFDDESTLGDRVKCDACGGPRHYYGCFAGTFWGQQPKCTRDECPA
jgi:hypothetical protein